MANQENQPPTSNDASNQTPRLERSTYEIIRSRLETHAAELRSRVEQLNDLRRDVFGSISTELKGTERINTANNCVPRDIVSIGNRILFGYNVHFGLRTETKLSDVFSIYHREADHFVEESIDPLNQATFEHDFQQLYRYYKDTTFNKFHVIGPFLYLVFRVGRAGSDLKSFKFLIENGNLKYVDNRSDHEVVFPSQHEFEWIRTHRDLHRGGMHPHVSIEDRVFVETVGGDLTVKIEDNTDDGLGIYREPVEDADQTLDDAEIFYAIVGNLILMKIKPFREENYRYLIFNEKTGQVSRLDSIEQSCILLPEDHGLIFSNGVYLQSGEQKTFESELTNLTFERSIPASNGEDYLFVFYHRDSGHYVLLSYNMIEQQVQTPLVCHGFSLFDDGSLICFRSDDTAQKHHALQVWQTPFLSAELNTAAKTDSYLYKIGNKDVVRAMAESTELINLIGKDDTYSDLYIDLVKKSNDLVDSYFWLGEQQTFNLAEPVQQIREAATAAVDEFDKVVRVRKNTAEQFQTTSAEADQAISDSQVRPYRQIHDFVESLATLRTVRGRVISLKELKYIELEKVETLESRLIDQTDTLSHQCVKFLLRDDALKPYSDRVDQQNEAISSLETVANAQKLEDEITAGSNELEMLIDIVSNLKIDDATHRTRIIDNISMVYATLNQTRASLKKKSQALMSVEGAAEFNSQLKLISQAIVNYLDICDSPQKCDEYLTKMMVQVEELEGKFSEFDEFIVQLAEKREEIYAAFDNRKLQITEARNRRATALMSSADRILTGIQSRISSMESVDDINSYFASDLMIEKVRDIIQKLDELDESVKVDDIQSRLKTVREDAVRQLHDKKELYVGGKNVIQFGPHKFSVNVQQLDLTTVVKEGETFFHLSGTNYFEPIDDPRFTAAKDVWDQSIVSENKAVYRAEYLAFLLLNLLIAAGPAEFEKVNKWELDQYVQRIQTFMAPRYAEGYVKGVHDHDAALILQQLVRLTHSLDHLKYSTSARTLATLFWNSLPDDSRNSLNAKFESLAKARQLFGPINGRDKYIERIEEEILSFVETSGFSDASFASSAANCLFDQQVIARSFVASGGAVRVKEAFQKHVRTKHHQENDPLGGGFNRQELSIVSRYEIARDWLTSFAVHTNDEASTDELDEAAALLTALSDHPLKVINANPITTIEGLLGDHPQIEGKSYRLDYNKFIDRLNYFQSVTVPRFEDFVALKKTLVDHRREELRLEEFKPRVLTSFVRNKLINDVYLPLVGANLAKQMGVVGEDKRTDLMGLLLLISPPGYGKTTLMEYIANRLGITFVKINGPAIGHHVTSLDPAEAPNASAREEVEKLNLSLEMGDNVMIYLDDIQHCNPEFLQKFISLCDATRRIEGVFRGRTRTYDLRGRKVCVVMAGNPYTESGEKFQIPDMLANRADTYNLGDVIGDTQEVFNLSYLENCLTSNSALAKLQARSRNDIYAIIDMAMNPDGPPQSLEGNYSIEEINEFVSVMKKLLIVRDVVLRVNREYIDSAAQADEYRTEPAFKMQGSYRDMNKIAERIVPIMNDDELQTLIMSHYENQAQTLTTGAESNLLKFREMIGTLEGDDLRRWQDIQQTYQRNQILGSTDENDQVGKIISQMTLFTEGLRQINNTLDRGMSEKVDEGADTIQTVTMREIARVAGELGQFNETLESIKTAYETNASTIANLPRHLTEQKIEVINKVPNAILDVLRNQFRVLQTWMEPILQLAHSNESAAGFVQASQATAQNYEKLMDKMVSESKSLELETPLDPELLEKSMTQPEDTVPEEESAEPQKPAAKKPRNKKAKSATKRKPRKKKDS